MRAIKASLIALYFCAVQVHAAGLAGQIITVLGPVDAGQAGHTLMHEHLFIDFTLPDAEPDRWQQAGRNRLVAASSVALYNAPLTMGILGDVALGAYNRDNWQLSDEATAIAGMQEFKRRGGSTLVDATSMGAGRNPVALQRVARATGVNIVMGTGWFGAGWWPADMAGQTVQSLTEQIIRDLTVGVDGTDVRAGIIGEVGVRDPDDPVTHRILRASARASQLTGAAVSVSPGQNTSGVRVLEVLTAAGADLRRVIIGHADFHAAQPGYLKTLLDRGVTLQFDLLGRPPQVTRAWPIDSVVAQTIVDLAKAGYADRLLLSHDIHTKISLAAYGGTGYGYIEQFFLPYLKRLGLSDAQITTIIEKNPQRLLTLAAPGRPRS